jgi:hypothetical protein
MDMCGGDGLGHFELIVHIKTSLCDVFSILFSFFLGFPLSLLELEINVHLEFWSVVFIYVPRNVLVIIIFVDSCRVYGVVRYFRVVHMSLIKLLI